jgi:hypothetical protein
MGGSASFSTSVETIDAVTYQWRRNGLALIATPKITGVTEPTLSIADVHADNLGVYTCAITGPCGTIISNGAALTLTHVPGDFDADGDVDMKDFGFLQTCLTGVSVPVTTPACNSARLDQDLDVDIIDVEYFQRCLTGTDVEGSPACAG